MREMGVLVGAEVGTSVAGWQKRCVCGMGRVRDGAHAKATVPGGRASRGWAGWSVWGHRPWMVGSGLEWCRQCRCRYAAPAADIPITVIGVAGVAAVCCSGDELLSSVAQLRPGAWLCYKLYRRKSYGTYLLTRDSCSLYPLPPTPL